MRHSLALLKSNIGFGMIEIVMSIGILTFAIIGALFSLGANTRTHSNAAHIIQIQSLRFDLVGALQNDSAWSATVAAVANSTLSCIRSGTDCRSSTGGSFALYSSDGNLEYDANTATNGFTFRGTTCTGFDATNGNAACPIRLNLTWQPLCPPLPATCFNPPVQINGTFVVAAGPDSVSLATAGLNFSFQRQRIYCQAPMPTWDVTANSGAVTASSSAIAATGVGLGYPVGSAYSTAIIPCYDSSLEFSYGLSYSGGATAGGAGNQAQVCIFAQGTAGTPCLYEWIQQQTNWRLRVNGADVYTPPATIPLLPDTIFQFRMNNGLMTFHVNYQRVYTFSTPTTTPLRAAFWPGTTSFSPNGIRIIDFRFR